MKLPIEFIKKYQKLLGSSADEFVNSFKKQSISAFRVENKRNLTDFSSYQPIEEIPNSYYGKISGNSIEFLAGALYSQEPSAMYVAKVLAPKENDLVLDLCAAPGGKSTYLASQLNGEGYLLANDIDLKRSKVLAENIGRMGYSNVAVSNETPENLSKKFPETFSKILVDAPCSGEGMFRKDPEAIKYWSSEYPSSCARLQKKILSSAIKMLAPEGILVYSTCTFSPEEDEGVVSSILESNRDLKLLEFDFPTGGEAGVPDFGNGDPELKKCLRLYPHRYKGEGQFIAKFQKMGQIKSPKKSNFKLQSKISPIFTEFMNSTFVNPISDVFNLNDAYYSLDLTFYDLVKDLHLVKKGVKIGDLKKNRFVPHQDIFLAQPHSNFKKIIELDGDQFRAYRHGEELKIEEVSPTKQWVALSYQGYVFGFGHLVQNRIKNFYPKNLRN